jgi:hypothetical protein
VVVFVALYVGMNVFVLFLSLAAMVPFFGWMAWQTTAGREPLAAVDLVAVSQAEIQVPGDKGLEFWVELDTQYTPPKAHYVALELVSAEQQETLLCDALNPTMKQLSQQSSRGGRSSVRYTAHMRCDLAPQAGPVTLKVERQLMPSDTAGLEKMTVLIYAAR